ncbi:DUF4352 domain-containing protein [Bacillus pumilus]|uniref:DUF4352 domain-containing protein n=1 Tax=Bacillus pumilus TaxID=1408 RepID=UPI002282C6E7|nr:DUF4352 domain-containing protein [Bacillus pumilus]MCY7437250.1 DUF4352 domain-containing protein [Bacillus pumilus]
MFKKKLSLFLLILCVTVVAAACSGGKEKSAAKEKDTKSLDAAEVKVESAEYTLPPQYDTSVQDDQYVLKVNVSVKNISKEPLNVDKSNFTLYQDDSQVSTISPDDYNEVLSSSSLNADKVSKGGLFFVVDKDKDYQLVYNEPGSGSKKDDKTLEFDIKGKDLMKKADTLQASAKALSSYIDVMIFGKNNNEFEKLTGDNKSTVVNQFDKSFKQGYITSSGISSSSAKDENLDKLLKAVKETLAEKSKVSTKTKAISGDKAVVTVTLTPIDASPLVDRLKEKATEFYSKNRSASYDEAQKYLLSIYPEEFKKLGPSSSEETVEVNMKKNDIDQWKLDLNDYKTSSLVEKFIKN